MLHFTLLGNLGCSVLVNPMPGLLYTIRTPPCTDDSALRVELANNEKIRVEKQLTENGFFCR